MRGLVFDESNMRDAFDIICQTLVSRADRFGLKAVDNERRLAQRISNILYGYNLYWAEGTEYKERIVNIHNEMEKEKQRLQMVEPLRTKLSLQKSRKIYDAVALIAQSFLLEDVVKRMDDINTREDLYDICVPQLIKRFKQNEYNKTDFYLMNILSEFVLGTDDAWFDKYDLDKDSIFRSLNIVER